MLTHLLAASCSLILVAQAGSPGGHPADPRAQPAPARETRLAHGSPGNAIRPGLDRALAFDGIDDFVSVPACGAMRYAGTGGWTVELWVKPVVYPYKHESSIIGQESVGVDGHDPWSLRIHPTHFEFRVDGPDGGTESVRMDLALGVWQHVACVYENATDENNGQERWIAVYVNGKLIERRATSVRMESRNDPVYFGALAGTHFRGLIDDARVWSVALGRDRVGLAMIGGVEPGDAGLRAWWDFDEAHGPVAVDRSLSATHAVLGRPSDPNDRSAPTRVLETGL